MLNFEKYSENSSSLAIHDVYNDGERLGVTHNAGFTDLASFFPDPDIQEIDYIELVEIVKFLENGDQN